MAGSRCGGLIIVRCGELMVAGSDGGWISVWGADNSQVWGTDGG